MQFASRKSHWTYLDSQYICVYGIVACVVPFLVTIIGILRDRAGTKRPSPHLNIRHSTAHDIWAGRDGSDGGGRSYIRPVTGAQLASLANSRYSRIGGSYHVRFWSHGGWFTGTPNQHRAEVLAKPRLVRDSGALPIRVAGVISKWQNNLRNSLRISDKGWTPQLILTVRELYEYT